MLNEKKELKNNELNNKELPEGVTELSMEDLEQVTGGHTMGPDVSGVIGQAIAQGVLSTVFDGVN